jgi:hypothetical protein
MENKHVPGDAKTVKPTLMGRPNLTPIADDGDADARILSNLKIQPSSKPQSNAGQKSSTIKTLAVLSLGAAAAFFGYQYVSETAKGGLFSAANQSPATKASKGQNAVIDERAVPLPATIASAPVAATAPLEAAPVAVAAVTEAAQIVNEPSAAKLTAALEEGVKPPKATIQKALEAKETSKAQAIPKPAAPSTTNEKKPTVVATKDKDVNLLAALITHNNAPAAPADVKQSVVAKNNPPLTTKSASAVIAPEKPATEPATLSAQTTESQLKQCRELGFFEREVCRMKTCNNLWETNAACKASLSPNAATPAEAQKTAAQKPSPAPAAVAPSASNSGATEAQLKQCGDLGFFEREACRMKTCTNLWETNAACKATLSPNPAVTADAQKR